MAGSPHMILASQVLAALIVLQCFQIIAFSCVLIIFIQLGVWFDTIHFQKNVLSLHFSLFYGILKA